MRFWLLAAVAASGAWAQEPVSDLLVAVRHDETSVVRWVEYRAVVPLSLGFGEDARLVLGSSEIRYTF